MKADMTKEGALCVALRCVALRIREQLETCLYYLFSLGHANIVMMPIILRCDVFACISPENERDFLMWRSREGFPNAERETRKVSEYII